MFALYTCIVSVLEIGTICAVPSSIALADEVGSLGTIRVNANSCAIGVPIFSDGVVIACYVSDLTSTNSSVSDSSGSGFSEIVPAGTIMYSVPKPPNNPNKATCKSDEGAREANASYQVRQYQALRLASGERIMRAGSIVIVKYDDGSHESWQIDSPLLTDPLMPIPLPGTMTGCSASA
jgi:hypothetical protein